MTRLAFPTSMASILSQQILNETWLRNLAKAAVALVLLHVAMLSKTNQRILYTHTTLSSLLLLLHYVHLPNRILLLLLIPIPISRHDTTNIGNDVSPPPLLYHDFSCIHLAGVFVVVASCRCGRTRCRHVRARCRRFLRGRYHHAAIVCSHGRCCRIRFRAWLHHKTEAWWQWRKEGNAAAGSIRHGFHGISRGILCQCQRHQRQPRN
jgi:hypothetical protein